MDQPDLSSKVRLFSLKAWLICLKSSLATYYRNMTKSFCSKSMDWRQARQCISTVGKSIDFATILRHVLSQNISRFQDVSMSRLFSLYFSHSRSLLTLLQSSKKSNKAMICVMLKFLHLKKENRQALTQSEQILLNRLELKLSTIMTMWFLEGLLKKVKEWSRNAWLEMVSYPSLLILEV